MRASSQSCLRVDGLLPEPNRYFSNSSSAPATEKVPFALDTDGISLEKGRGLDALGIKMIKSKAKEFFYRRYAGFNTLVVRV